ncbi:MAG: TorF family putative porin [Steroidobacteraceae bacterium]
MKHLKVGSILGLLALSGMAHAEISSTITLTNDYDFRGMSQSAEDPALQASFDYADARSGWYAGAWASNVDFGDKTDLELDIYTGFTGKTDAGLGWDAGFVYYTYDEDKYNFPEIYTAFNYSYFDAKLSYTNDWGGRGTDGKDALYLSVGATVPLPIQNLSALAHIGRSEGNNGFTDYTDYAVGVAYTVNKFDLGLKYVDTNLPNPRSDVFNSEGRFVFTVATTLPW